MDKICSDTQKHLSENIPKSSDKNSIRKTNTKHIFNKKSWDYRYESFWTKISI